MALFGGLFLHEFEARGGVEKQILDRDHCAARRANRAPLLKLARPQSAALCRSVVAVARRGRKLADGGDARQRFAAKAERAVCWYRSAGLLQFAGRVAGKSEFGFVDRNTAAVVADLDTFASVTAQSDANVRRSGIERVFEQFLDDRCWTLNHLPGGDLRDHIVS